MREEHIRVMQGLAHLPGYEENRSSNPGYPNIAFGLLCNFYFHLISSTVQSCAHIEEAKCSSDSLLVNCCKVAVVELNNL